MKNIVLIAPNFYEYPLVIKEAMNEIGYNVDYYNSVNENINKLYYKFLFKVQKNKKKKMQEKYYTELLKMIEDKEINLFLFIKIDDISIEFLEKINEKFKKSKKILYEWDDISKYPNIVNKFKYFDKVVTYSLFDSILYKIDFLPMFIKKIDISRNKQKKMFYIGTIKRERIYSLISLKKILKEKKIEIDTKIYLKKIRLVLELLKNFKLFYNLDIFTTTKMSYRVMMKELSNSEFALDLKAENQTGLTTRIVEALSVGTKIVTNNIQIKNYNFFDQNNIFIFENLEELNTLKFEEFSKLKYSKRKIYLLKKLEIKNWLLEILK